ncbi:RNA 2'-phosphotransferase [Motilimonas cestriensis]|uniref:Probable RNA 2'-phosphotransferase n=1 Tax=Motilimonas cestriensis TaxID=2742685 RepID=A0ABS8W4I7_9GAMM|nr:RNA 2'-phosphotransferase [Motilimonas cestriensis]MCE2593395.1 RNA 2'-phosphotransferase [Motilimonas cestriensis]
MNKEFEQISKYLSYLLRHAPESIGLRLDPNGWAYIADIIEKSTSPKMTKELLQIVVETNDKQRFSISRCGNKIRANQGHSVEIDLTLEPTIPPSVLLHGTAKRFMTSIMAEGISKQKRHHVHLSEADSVANAVGARYGKPVILKVDAEQMAKDGFLFFKTANNVWLVEHVPAKYLKCA